MWIKLDDGFATHPKLLKAGPLAMALQVRAICYASHHKTDGEFPCEALPGFILDLGSNAEDWIATMVSHGLWEPRDHGYYVHDYLEWNVSKKELLAMQKQKSLAGRKGMKARWGKRLPTITHVITDDITPANNTLILSTSSPNHLNSPNPEGEKILKKRGLEEFEQFWRAYPKKTGKKETLKAWMKATDKPTIQDIVAIVEQHRQSDQWNRAGGQYIPLPATWLNQGRWADQPCEMKGRPNGQVIPPFPGPDDPIGRGRWRQAYGNDPEHPTPRS